VPVNSLAGLALQPLLDGRLRFIPERYAKTYQSWLQNLRDWPISRQLWWGHRIPIWRCVAKTGPGYPSKTVNPGQFRVELQRRLNNFSTAMGIGSYHVHVDPERYPFFICSSGNDTDKAWERILSLREVITSPGGGDAQPINYLPLPGFPNAEASSAAHQVLHMIASIEQDDDVLDTWFSSALWPFSTLGWPDDTPELKTFYPSDVLC